MSRILADTAAAAHPARRRWSVRLMVAISCLLLLVVSLAAHVATTAEDFRASDDNLWMYYAGSNLADWDRGQQLNARLVDHLKDAGASSYIVSRAVLRTGYAANMAFTAGVLHATGLASEALRGPGASYDQRIGDGVLFGYMACFTIAAFLVVAALLALRNARVALAWLLGVASILCLTAWVDAGFFILFRTVEPGPHLSNLLNFLLDPGPQFSPFGFTPRNTVYVLSFAIVAFRALGRYGLGYWCIVPLAFVHQSVSALMFALFIGCDVLLRAHVFRRRGVLTGVAAFVLLLAARENLWEVIGVRPGQLALAAVALAVVAGIGWALRRRLVAAHAQVRRRVQAIGEMEADALLLLAGFFLTYPFVFLVVRHLDEFTMVHFWGQLHARIWAHIQPWVLFTAWWALLRRWDDAAVQRRFVPLLGVVLLLLVPKVVSAWSYDYGFRGFRDALAVHERTRDLPFATVREAEEREDRFFYEMARTLDTGEDSLTMLFRRISPGAR